MNKILFVIFILLGTKVFTQELPNVVPPSPEAQAFQKFGDIPVSYYTGVPNISIPIYTLSEGNVSVPISLSYHASGIKVDQEASRVGLGWALIAGGMISRTVVGKDDFSTDLGAYHASYENGGSNQTPVINMATQGIFNLPAHNIQYADSIELLTGSLNLPAEATDSFGEIYDFEPDQYSFNFMGYSGSFILKPNKEVVLSAREKIRIICVGDADSWEIWTPDGMHYIFDVVETYNDETVSVNSTWLLSQVISPTGHMVMFQYEKLQQQYVKTIGAYQEVSNAQYWNGGPGSGPGAVRAQKTEGPIIGKEYDNVRLESIQSNLGKVEFFYGFRDDLEGETKVDSIAISKWDSTNDVFQKFKDFKLDFEYFTTNVNGNYEGNNNGNTNYQSKRRLKLVSLQERAFKGNQIFTKPAYQFKYNEDLDMPAKTLFSRDHWGYFNGKGNNSLIPSFTTFQDITPAALIGLRGPERDTDPIYLQVGILSEIIYPTGGSTLFEFEANDYDKDLSNIDDSVYTAPYYTKSDFKRYNASTDTGTISEIIDFSDAYDVINGNGLVNLKVDFRLSNYNCSTTTTNQTAVVRLYPINENGTIPNDPVWSASIGSATCEGSIPFLRYEDDFQIQPREYLWQAEVGNPIFSQDSITDVTMYYSYPSTDIPETNDEKFYYAGGLRIKKITQKSNMGQGKDIITNYDYHHMEDRNEDGALEEYSNGILMSYPRYCYFENSITSESSVTYLVRASQSSIPLMGNPQGNIVGYSEVTVSKSGGGQTGKTVYKYYNSPNSIIDYRIASSGLNGALYPARPPLKPLLGNRLNGLLSEQLDYKSIGSDYALVREVRNDYYSNEIPNDNNIYYGIELRRLKDGSSAYAEFPDVAFLYPSIESNFTNITKTTERLYDQTDTTKYVEIVNDYSYDYVSHLQLKKETTTDSRGNTVSKEYKYPDDVANTASLGAMAIGSDNLIAIDSLKEDNQHRVNEVIQTKIDRINNGTLLSSSTTRNDYKVWTNGIVLPDSVKTLKGIYDSQLNPMDNRIVFDRYDSMGNPLQVSRVNGPTISYIFGYDQSYPVAKIENVNRSQIDNLPGFGQDFHTGETGLSAAQETAIRGISGAMVTTYTYDPLVGVISMTDPRGYTIYYEYDEFNRLKEVRDDDNNIVTDYQYHYQGQN